MEPVVVVVLVAVAAPSTVSASAGFGGSLILVPALALQLGTKSGAALAALLLASCSPSSWTPRPRPPAQPRGARARVRLGSDVRRQRGLRPAQGARRPGPRPRPAPPGWALSLASLVGDVTKTAIWTEASLIGTDSYLLALAAVPLMIGATLGRQLNNTLGERGYAGLFWMVMVGYTALLVSGL